MISQITDRHFIGELLDCNKENLEKHGIFLVLNVSENNIKILGFNGWIRWAPIIHAPLDPPKKFVNGMWVDCPASEIEAIAKEFIWEVTWAYHYLADLDFSEGDLPIYTMSKVLICCNAGMDRSPFVLAYYLHQRDNMTFEKAYDLIASKRPIITRHPEWVKYMVGTDV